MIAVKIRDVNKYFVFVKILVGQTCWYKVAGSGQVEILQKLWNWTKELQLKPQELRNMVFLSKNNSVNSAWHKEAERGQVEILQKLWDWAK